MTHKRLAHVCQKTLPFRLWAFVFFAGLMKQGCGQLQFFILYQESGRHFASLRITMKSFAVVFPGQGSQSVGMLESFMSNKIVAQTFEEANEALGYDLKKIVLTGPDTELNKTEITQPAILTASVAAWRALMAAAGGDQPKACAGHSLGEYTALVAAEAISFADAVRLVRLRGQAMQEAVPAGTGAMMAVLGLDDDAVVGGCADVSKEGDAVWSANFNTPGQVVISGSKDAVARAGEYFAEKGARRCVALPVSVPSHCPMMQPAADKLAAALADIELCDASIPVYANVLARPVVAQGEIIDCLVKQLVGSVRWVETVQNMKADGIEALIEVGPGKVLTGLNRKIDKTLVTGNIASDEELAKVLESLNA